jgi:RNA-directed DNA polymerase
LYPSCGGQPEEKNNISLREYEEVIFARSTIVGDGHKSLIGATPERPVSGDAAVRGTTAQRTLAFPTAITRPTLMRIVTTITAAASPILSLNPGTNMERIDNIYDEITSKENLYRAAFNAAKGKRYTDSSADFFFRLEDEIENLHRALAAETYSHGPYRQFTIRDPKKRLISAAPFRDRVVHHAVNDVIEPKIDRTFAFHSYACRSEKGTHRAVDTAQRYIKNNELCLHGDVKKYFPSINHGILKTIIARKIKDAKLLRLIGIIIDSSNVQSGCVRGKGLPIGNLTSQLFANFYLNELDRFVKHGLRSRYYIRYMDDFLVFGSDKARLAEVKDRIRTFLKDSLDLDLHEGKSQIHRTKRGIVFLGFRVFGGHKMLAPANVRRFKRRLKVFGRLYERGEMNASGIISSVQCWVSHSLKAKTLGLRRNIFGNVTAVNTEFAGVIENVLLKG